jgi:chemotaxis signal transduction protein
MRTTLPVPAIVAGDTEALEHRARLLAAGDTAEDDAAGLLRLVTFRLGGMACAVETGPIERAVVLSAPIPVPLADGSERPVAFVDERPLPVVDLAGTSAGAPRRAAELAGVPALVVATAAGSVAVAVEGPLELAEDRLAAAVASGAPRDDGLRLAGRLAGGAALVDPAWLVAFAERAASR